MGWSLAGPGGDGLRMAFLGDGLNRTAPGAAGDLVLRDDIPSLEKAMVVAEKLQKATAMPIPYGDGLIDVSLSIGVALHGAGEDVDLFVRRADRAMFAAKAAGRNQVVAL